MDHFVKGTVEVISLKDGKVLSKSKNAFTLNGEDLLAQFLKRSFSNKYDDNEGLFQSGYYDFIAIGTGFLSPILGTESVLVLPNKLIGIPDEDTDCFNGAKVDILSGDNDGLSRLVALDGYNPSNALFENRPTITISEPLPVAVASGVQFVIESISKETALQGEGRPDFKGATLDDQARHLFQDKKILGSDTTPIGSSNEVYITTEVPAYAVTGGASVKICEAALVNSDIIPVSPDLASGKMIARTVIAPVELGPGGSVLMKWRLRFGAQR